MIAPHEKTRFVCNRKKPGAAAGELHGQSVGQANGANAGQDAKAQRQQAVELEPCIRAGPGRLARGTSSVST